MSATICGHNRDAVKAVLLSLKEYDDFGYKRTPTPSQFYLTCSDPAWSVDDAEAIRRDVSDPAKIAEIMIEEGRRLALGVAGPVHIAPPWEVWGYRGRVYIDSQDTDERFMRAWFAVPTMPETHIWIKVPRARRILLQWLGLPDGARDAAEKMLRGDL